MYQIINNFRNSFLNNINFIFRRNKINLPLGRWKIENEQKINIKADYANIDN